jgi:tetratricopeptide (TPR) repeat protein
MQERRFAEAEAIYREDLKRRPENGWALFGLAESLKFQGKLEEANSYRERHQRIWVKSDIKINASCLCQPGL